MNCKMMKTARTIQTAVITGPTGAIGTALCRLLSSAGVLTYAVCRPGSSRIAALPKHEKIVPVLCDASELDKLPQLISGKADVFYHLAWADTIGSGRNNMSSQIRNIQYTIDAVRSAAVLGCGVFIGAGSQAECGRVDGILRADTPCFPENGYGMAKLCAGQMSRIEAQRLGVEHIWTRILSVYGPHDGPMSMITGTVQALLRGEKPKLTMGEQLWDYLYSADAARALYRMALYGRSGALYPLGSGQACPLRSYVETLRNVIDPSLELGFGEIPYGPQQVMRLQADIDTLRHDTGFEPKTPFEVGIRETIEWIKGGE